MATFNDFAQNCVNQRNGYLNPGVKQIPFEQHVAI
jgi:hypothetical protein